MTTDARLTAVHRLPAIDLASLLEIAELQTRTDRKYLVPLGTIEDLLGRLDARVLEIDGRRDFGYQSVYFDTPDMTSYLSAARRRPRRFKVRTRTYTDTGDCMLEVKTRDPRGRTVKHRSPYLMDRRYQLTDDARDFLRSVDATATVEGLQPTLTTTYRRATVVLAETTARVTLDVDVAFQSTEGSAASLGPVALVETKTAGPPCAADRALWRQGHRPTTISKYCTGLAALTPELPANKWHRVLRTHFD